MIRNPSTTETSVPPDRDAQPNSQMHSDRQHIMRCCTLATDEELLEAVKKFPQHTEAVMVRKPETGLVMLRGRVGGDGAPFNVGEATVTRAVVRLPTGEAGYSYLLGRSHERARSAAILDAIGQDTERRKKLNDVFVTPVMERLQQDTAQKQHDTAATRVDFFTLVRGED